MTLTTLIKLVKKEIEWSMEHKAYWLAGIESKGKITDYRVFQEGYIAGLNHTLWLVKKGKKLDL